MNCVGSNQIALKSSGEEEEGEEEEEEWWLLDQVLRPGKKLLHLATLVLSTAHKMSVHQSCPLSNSHYLKGSS
jgi:hypothetical protein